ncbi:hypothetical protein J1TS5_03870 [Paenibacillus macerans]|nr:hypothetical protein J1TS5_03870 [Paenibacillus macerans]
MLGLSPMNDPQVLALVGSRCTVDDVRDEGGWNDQEFRAGLRTMEQTGGDTAAIGAALDDPDSPAGFEKIEMAVLSRGTPTATSPLLARNARGPVRQGRAPPEKNQGRRRGAPHKGTSRRVAVRYGRRPA